MFLKGLTVPSCAGHLLSFVFLWVVLLAGPGCDGVTNNGEVTGPTTTTITGVRLSPTPSRFTVEYSRQASLGLIGASAAYERGWTGEGVTVGLLDGGLMWGHQEFTGAIAGYPVLVEVVTPSTGDPYVRRWRLSEAQAQSAYQVSNDESSVAIGTFSGAVPTLLTDRQVDNDIYSEIGVARGCSVRAGTFACAGLGTTYYTLGHGVAVSGIVAARRDDRGIYGVAYDSKVLMGLSGAQFNGVSDLADLSLGGMADFRREKVEYLNRHVKIAVHSYSAIPNEPYSAGDVLLIYNNLASALEQRGTEPAERTIHVYAAGNACPAGAGRGCDTTSPAYPAILPYYFAQLPAGSGDCGGGDGSKPQARQWLPSMWCGTGVVYCGAGGTSDFGFFAREFLSCGEWEFFCGAACGGSARVDDGGISGFYGL